jgi:hypothetical protein
MATRSPNPDQPVWAFRRMQPGEMNVDPIEGEFFSTEALDSLADALVRESIQNSLDARRSGTTLRMRFSFSRPETALAGERKTRYLAGLMDHLRAARSGIADLPHLVPATDPGYLGILNRTQRSGKCDPSLYFSAASKT